MRNSEEISYQKFLEQNGEHLKRFVREFIMDNLKMELEINGHDWIEGKLKLGDKIFSYSESYVRN